MICDFFKMGLFFCCFWFGDLVMFGWDDVFGVSVRKGDFCVFIYILNDKIVDFLICNGFLSKDCRKF